MRGSNNRKKPVFLSLLVSIAAMAFLLWFSANMSPILRPGGGGQTTAGKAAEQVGASMINKLAEPLQKVILEAATGGQVSSQTSDARDSAGAQATVVAYMRGVVLMDGESARSHGKPGSGRPEVEIRGLEVGQPITQPLTDADKLNGILGKCLFPLKASAHRLRQPDGQWTKWMQGTNLVYFYCVNLEKHAGGWVVVQGPGDSYQKPVAAPAEPVSGIFRRRADGTMEKVN